MPLALQAKLLRALQEGEIEPVGSNQQQTFDVRVIAATSRDLVQQVREGKFREDLFYRLNVLPLRVPPLRDRTADLPALVETLADDLALRNQTAPLELNEAALQLLAAQTWRGNIRELRNVLEQAALQSDGDVIDAPLLLQVLRDNGVDVVASQTLPAAHAAPSGLAEGAEPDELRPLAEQIAQLESKAIAQALQKAKGNKTLAAKWLGLSRATLYERLSASR